MKKLFSAFLLSVFTAVVLMSCAPSTKNEIQYWENNKKDYAEAVMKYPAFKTFLDQKMTEAQAIWGEAQKITSDEEKAKKMKEANEKINSLLNQFTQIKFKSKAIDDAITKFNSKKLTQTEDKIRQTAKAAAFKVLDETAAILANAKPASEEEVMNITKDVIGKLITGKADIDRAIKSVEPKKAPKK